MSTTIGYSTLQVIPSMKGFAPALSRQVNSQMGAAGTAGGKVYGGKMLASVKSFAAPVAGAFAAIKVIGLFKDSIQGASALSESASKVGVVFGKAGAQIMEASKTSATAMGLSKAAYLENTSTLGNLLVSLKIAPKEAATMSQSMVKLASDMASLNNTSVDEAFQALRSGLTGETEPLKRFGVNMNESTLKTMALKMGLIETTKTALDPQTKALAAQALIMDQTGTAQGDFTRTSAGLANQQRIAAAQTEDLKTKLGQGLLPITIAVTTAYNKFVTGMMEGTGVGGKFKDVVVGIFNAIKPFVTFLINNKDKVFLFFGVIGGGVLVFKGLTLAIKASTAAAALYRGVMTSLMITQVAAIGPMTAMGVGATATSVATSRLAASMALLRTAIFNIPIVGWIAAAVTVLALLYIKFEGVRNVVAIVANEIIKWFQGIVNVGIGMVNVLIKAWNFIPWHKDIKLLANVELPHLATAAENAAKRITAASYSHPTRGPIKGSGKSGVGTGVGTGVGDSSKIIDAINLKISIEGQKQNLREFSRFLSKDFVSSLKDSGTKAADIIGKLVGGVDTLVKGFAATITDEKKQGTFNLASTKIINNLNTKLLGFESAFDAINLAREGLKTKIADAESGLAEAVQLRADAANSISELLSKPFGQPSELFKSLSGAEASADSIIGSYNSMVKMVTDRFKSIGGGKKDALLGFLKDQTTRLLSLAVQRAEIAKQLDLAQTNLENLGKEKTAYADSLSGGLKSASLSLSDFIDKENGAASPAAIIAGFTARLNIIKNFSTNLKALAARGVSQNLLDQIIGMGAADGGALATSLATASDSQIAALNATGVEIAATADALGAAMSDKFYNQSINDANNIVKGWKDKQADIQAGMTSVAMWITANLEPLTDSMASLGTDSAQALLDGFKSQDNALIAQATSLGARMAQAVADALAALNVASGGANFNVAESKATAAKLADNAAKAFNGAAQQLAQVQETERETKRLTAAKTATSADIEALGNKIFAGLSSQANKIQMMQRQGL